MRLSNRVRWCQLLSETWQHYVPSGLPGKPQQIIFKLGLLAIDLSHWALAKACFQACWHWYGEHIAVLHNFALATHATGDSESALAMIEQARHTNPDDTQLQALQQEIQKYQTYCQTQTWYTPQIATQGKLRLQPLAEHHAGEFYWQYRNSSIASLIRSYSLESLEAVQDIIQHWQQQATKQSYAIIHQQFGYIGCVALEQEDTDTQQKATFSIWIGEDYQNNG